MRFYPALAELTLLLALLAGVVASPNPVEAACTGQYKCKPFLNSWGNSCNQAEGSWFVEGCTGNNSNACLTSVDRDDACCDEVGTINVCTWDSTNPTPTLVPGQPSPTQGGGGGTCGAKCSSNSDCASGYSCTNDKVCWLATACGESVVKHRIKVKALDCNGNGASGVEIKAWGNTCTTGSNGTCIIFKNKACQDSVGGGGQSSTSVVAGKDANSAQPHYYTRVFLPSFTRESCATINCNYTDTPLTSSPYREAYHISSPTDDSTAQENLFIRRACSLGDDDANAGYDFKQISGCRPNAAISNVSNLTYGENLSWTVDASDADGNVTESPP